MCSFSLPLQVNPHIVGIIHFAALNTAPSGRAFISAAIKPLCLSRVVIREEFIPFDKLSMIVVSTIVHGDVIDIMENETDKTHTETPTLKITMNVT